MKIIKLAQGVPDGYVKIRITIGPDGTQREEIIREGKSLCKEGDGKKFLEDLLGAEIPGFEGMAPSVTEEGKTEEYYEQHRPKFEPPPVTNRETEDIGGFPVQEVYEREMDTGFGV